MRRRLEELGGQRPSEGADCGWSPLRLEIALDWLGSLQLQLVPVPNGPQEERNRGRSCPNSEHCRSDRVCAQGCLFVYADSGFLNSRHGAFVCSKQPFAEQQWLAPPDNRPAAAGVV
jgi:hypothetical protein